MQLYLSISELINVFYAAEHKKCNVNSCNCITFAPTVHTTLPIRTASQGVSFAFITFRHSVALPLHNAHYAALFNIILPALHTVRYAGGSFFFVPLAQ